MSNNLPFVSVATVTFNRRPFIKYLIQCIEHQDYKGKIEWVIIDDGTDKIEDLVCSLDFVKYFKYEEKMTLGKKRNILNNKCSGDIIVYFDDDDYYPPQRISHAVDVLLKNPNYLIAGSSLMHIYFKHIKQMYSFGPYNQFHSTAATFAFKKELLKETKFNDEDCLYEEKFFLKNYTIPLIQLDSKKTILVFSHIHNSFDKKELIEQPLENTLGKISNLTIDDFITDEILKNFYGNDIDNLLKPYTLGDISNKPDVLENIKNTKEKRKKIIEKMKNERENKQKEYDKIISSSNVHTILKNSDNDIKNNSKELYSKEYVDNLKKYYEKIIEEKTILISKLMIKLRETQNNKHKL